MPLFRPLDPYGVVSEITPVRRIDPNEAVYRAFLTGMPRFAKTDGHVAVDVRHRNEPTADAVMYVDLVWCHHRAQPNDRMVLARWHEDKLYMRAARDLGTWPSFGRDLCRELISLSGDILGPVHARDIQVVWVADDNLLQNRSKPQLTLLNSIGEPL